MGKMSNKYGATTRVGSGPIQSTTTVVTNHGGAPALSRTAKSDLFLLGVTNFVGEDTFYESAAKRDDRFVNLVRQVTAEDPAWVARFIPWLRNEANMRSASVVAAVEYVKAGGPNARKVIASACSRADEPAEVLAYWTGVYGRPIPSSVKRGVSDAAARLYNERSIVKYDGGRSKFKFADVINLAHAKPRDERQSALYKYALDSRYGTAPATDQLPNLALALKVNAGEITRDQLLSDPELIKRAGVTWETLSGLGQMDAAAWEAMIPNMGYMALLRNLRNFEQAGISAEATQLVVKRLSDPDEVAKSRQLPFRFWSAYTNVAGLQWGYPIEQALGHSLKNVPALGGKTLVLLDTSASMSSRGYTAKGTVTPLDAGAIFASALALAGESVTFRGFADGTFNIEVPKGGSILKLVEKTRRLVGKAGHGTNIPGAVSTWNGEDRVVIVTDMQTLGGYSYGYGRQGTGVRANKIPKHVPVFGFNLGGYGNTQIDTSKNEFEFGGLTDQTFKLIPLLERGSKQDWPF